MEKERRLRWPRQVPALKTPRLILRAIRSADLEGYFQINSDAAVMGSYGVKRHRKRSETAGLIDFLAQELAGKRMLRWGIFDRDTGTMAGDVGFWRFVESRARGEIGMKLHPDFQGRGLMFEALNAVFQCSFARLNLQSIEMNVEPRNRAAYGLCRKLGMSEVGVIKRHAWSDAARAYVDTACFSIAADEFRSEA